MHYTRTKLIQLNKVLIAADFNLNIIQTEPQVTKFINIMKSKGFSLNFDTITRTANNNCIDNIATICTFIKTYNNYKNIHKLQNIQIYMLPIDFVVGSLQINLFRFIRF